MTEPKVHSKGIRLFYFWIGIIATLCYRLIIVFNNISADLVKISWYIGTIGFIIYFVHRYQISETRAKIIKEHELGKKIANMKELSDTDRTALNYILKTLKSSKEKWNYIFIFVASAVTLLWGIYTDFIMK
ncbi:hypothetical protein A3F34_02815 [Candidatus Roizmanbacteria bacterium RIFCSPHIGHO2_12_FULL_44_10]|uniref:DUF3899 domain-containing protein n=1 Tax=Candidatus Roizmanbacteria bacterium RIFCSPHIGHO2_12_FULL_44_10 TaxID=1802054 RepID=A0A1F7I7S1_9BACT|nr:MAG: hypothetical protein A3F34_02815 [Candidatus Roizmanbacteria bacterium RIFCSPHIGHO2_12_FULL_44_10]